MSIGSVGITKERDWLWRPLPGPKELCRDNSTLLPRVTVVTPSYNQGAYLEETIRSVLMQDYPNLEYIIMDGGSSDNSVEIIKKYEPWLAYWSSSRDGGQSAAINAGWHRATGDVVAWQNADDMYCQGSIHEAVKSLQLAPEIAMVYGDCIAIDANGQPFAELQVPRQFGATTILRSFNNVVPSTTAFIRRAVVEKIGPLDTSLHYTMDFDYFLRLGLRYRALFNERLRSLIRIHHDAKSSKGQVAGLLEMYDIVSRLRETLSDSALRSACTEGLAIGATRLSLAFAAKSNFRMALKWRSISVKHALSQPLNGAMLALLVPGRILPWVRKYRTDCTDLGVRMVPDPEAKVVVNPQGKKPPPVYHP